MQHCGTEIIMKIAINSSHQRFGGAIQVALSFINECRNFPQHDFYVWIGPGVRKSLKEEEFPVNFHFEHFDFGVISFKKTFEINATMKALEQRIQPDVIIATSGPSYFHSKAPQIIGYNLGLYLYDELPFNDDRNWYREFRFNLKRRIHHYYFKRDADYFVVQTDDVNQRVQQALSTDKVLTVTNTASSYYRQRENYPAKLPVKNPAHFRFVTISSYYGHKNLEIIPKVLWELIERGVHNVEFVLTLKEEDFEKHIVKQEGIYNVGPVKPPECPSLYEECDGMFLPTLAECFSASYPEAMLMEKPIVTTSMSFAQSICQDAALYFTPKDPVSAAEQIIELMANAELREQLVELGKKRVNDFDTPRQRAEKYLRLCAAVCEGTEEKLDF